MVPAGSSWKSSDRLVIGRSRLDAEGRVGACRMQGRSGSIRAATGPPKDQEASRRNAKDHNGRAAPLPVCLRIFGDLSRNPILRGCRE